MRSLRGRLVAILLAVSAVGMILLAAITWTEQRSFLNERLDRQLQTAFEPTLRVVRGGQLMAPPDGGPPGGGPPSGDDPRAMPLGTYSAIYDAEGNVVVRRIFGAGEGVRIPNFSLAELSEKPQTIRSRGTGYRVAVRNLSGGGRVVVALPTTENREALGRLLLVSALAVIVMLVLLGASAWVLVGIGLRPLSRMGDTADAISGAELTGDDLAQRVEPADERSEIGRLGLALNRMLDRLERAFGEREASERRLRQFLSDASHELRTPLASIRGYAELHSMGAAAPEDVDRSMGRIEQEAERMGVLVEDMLALARLEEKRERDWSPVDLAQLAQDAVADARAAADDREISVETDADATVDGDAHQLQQVLANLLHNAVVHTPEGTPVEVSVHRDGSDVRVVVRDHGDGLPEGAGDEIFERFWRAEGGRERGRAGSGLGLSIVRSIVTAHNGQVTAQNASPGAKFTITLPATKPRPSGEV